MPQISINPFDNDRLKTRKVTAALRDLGLLPTKHRDRPNALEPQLAFIAKLNRALSTRSIHRAPERPFADLINSALGLVGGTSSDFTPPEGFAFVVDGDANYVVNGGGAYVVTEI